MKHNNFTVIQVRHHWLNHLLCWHRKKSLAVLKASNGAEIYCRKCLRKKYGYIYLEE